MASSTVHRVFPGVTVSSRVLSLALAKRSAPREPFAVRTCFGTRIDRCRHIASKTRNERHVMVQNNDWIQPLLSALRKLDRAAQQKHLEALLSTLSDDDRMALRRAIEMRQANVESELRSHQTHRRQHDGRKSEQKQAMLSRYHWLLQIIDHYQA